jgi:GPH family glycoside/pentoside/hexuronide:cation symporter
MRTPGKNTVTPVKNVVTSFGEEGFVEERPRAGSVVQPPLPLRTKLALGMGEAVQAIYVLIVGFDLNAFLLEVACLDAGYVGLIQLIPGIFDAINDPVIGTMSDRTNTRWGRRRPWILFACGPLGIAFFCLWQSIGGSNLQKFFYYLIVFMCCSIGITCIAVQTGSFPAEITDDYDERTTLSAFRLGVGNVVGLICVIIHTQIITAFTDAGDVQNGYRVSAAIFGVCMIASALVMFFNVEERTRAPSVAEAEAKPLSVIEGVRAVFANKPFIHVVSQRL